MVKYFSAEWLAQSHDNVSPTNVDHDADKKSGPKPHVPCMVQPRRPIYGRGYLQPKVKLNKFELGDPDPADSSSLEESETYPPLDHRTNSCTNLEMIGYSSGYESEAASPERVSTPVDEGSEAERDGGQRRVRTKFTAEQISKLEKIFNKHKYLDAGERVRTAQRLNLTETQVRTWFQNRRMKMKREAQDYLPPQIPPLMFQPLPLPQYHTVAGQRVPFPATQPGFYPASPVPPLGLTRRLHPSDLHLHRHLMIPAPLFG